MQPGSAKIIGTNTFEYPFAYPKHMTVWGMYAKNSACKILPRNGDRQQNDAREISLRERDVSFLGGRNSLLGAVLQHREVSQVAVEDFHARNVLTYGSPLGVEAIE